MFAAGETGIKGLIAGVKSIVDISEPVLLGLALIFFFWGMGQFILHDAGNDKTREDGKKKMLWGVIALFVFISIRGILAWVGDTVGVHPSGNPNVTTSEEYNLDQLQQP
jgi:hypothetical protein